MSIFDPQHLYYHRVRSTRKGQVLQQKPIKHQGAYDSDEIPRAASLLQAYGYTVVPPGRSPVTTTYLAIPYTYTGENFTLTSSSNDIAFTFQELWPNIADNFTPVFSHYAEAKSFSFQFYLLNFSLLGTFTRSTSTSANPNFYFYDSAQYLDPFQNGFTNLALESTNSVISISAQNNQYCSTVFSYLRSDNTYVNSIMSQVKKEYQNTAYLMNNSTESLSDITKFTDNSYEFDIVHVTWSAQGNVALPFTSSNYKMQFVIVVSIDY